MAQRFFDCSVSECQRPSARSGAAGCDICRRHFCGLHLSPTFHQCSIADLSDAAYEALMAAEINCLRAQINDKAVCNLAASLNGGTPCVLEYPSQVVGRDALAGCANSYARIRFEDGSPSWLLRVPRVTGFAVGFPVALAEYLIRSEFATLKFLETTNVPAPRAFSFGIPSQGTDHGVGVCFLLMEELRGKPWDGERGRGKVIKGLAAIYAELAKYSFHRAGSLCVQSVEEKPCVSAVASDRFVCLDPWGPCETSAEYYATWAEQYLILISDGQLHPEFPVDAYLVYQFLKENASQLLSDHPVEELFFLKHVDDKGDHLLVDEDCNITGIIDWQMARTVPRREAFALSLVSADMGALYDGRVSLGARDIELSRALREQSVQLAAYTGDEKVRRFFWGLGLETDWALALPLANAILQVFGVEQDWYEWKETQLGRCKGDEGLAALLRKCSEE